MRKILALTSIRSEYDLMSRLYSLLHNDSEVDLRLLVSGAHLSPAHGFTVTNIKNDGLEILAEIETLISGDSLSSRLKTASGLLSGSIDFVRQFQPDIIVLAGDREDVLVGGMLGGFLGLPTAHFFGGDHAADGHIDNPVRHATSKLASAHFVSITEHKERLLKLGEPASRIFVTGSVALDKFVSEPVVPLGTILDAIGAGSHARTNPLALLIFHPISQEHDVAADYIANATQALVELGFHVCIGAPNTDPGNYRLTQTLEILAQKPEVTFYRNLSRPLFINLLRHVRLITGNSSAGILEAATLKIPAINIGARQRGRLCAGNVIFTDGRLEAIRTAVRETQSPSFQKSLKTLHRIADEAMFADKRARRQRAAAAGSKFA